MNQVIPVLPAEPHSKDQWRVWCEHCAVWHLHGAGPGHRGAHCHVDASPYDARGYVLELDVEGSQRRVAAYIIPDRSEFTWWLLTQTTRPGWRGLFAQDVAEDKDWPEVDDLAALEDYFTRVGACDQSWDTLREAWAEFVEERSATAT